MSNLLAARVKETTTTAGTGTVNLAGAVSGFQGFVAGIGNGNPCYYTLVDGVNWEVGIGTVTDASPDTLSRQIILASSNAGAAINLSGGTTDVFCDAPDEAFRPDIDNPIINPAMEIWQRGTSFAAPTDLVYTADRWAWKTAGAGVVTISRSTDVPTVAQAGVLFNYSLDVDVTTADASIAAGDHYGVYQILEGYNWRHFAQRAFTVSFWVRDTITGEHAVAFTNSGTDRAYVATYTINVADTWEFKTVNVSASPSAGTWNYTNGSGLRVLFALAAGSNFQTTAGAWQTGQFFGTATTVNSLSSTSNFFRVTGVKMELGSVATPLQFRSFQDELALCQRYYEISYDYGVAPATVTAVGQITGWNNNGGAGLMNYVFKVTKRADPSVVTYSPTTGNSNYYNQSGVGDVVNTPAGIGMRGFTASSSGGTASAVLYGHFLGLSEL